ncbi:hypothetical protein KEM54_001959 [Ascosphaera aggregata]|nr:hypothetical protein KEM54_001959 [Ascosphaera aggregata]
MSAAFSLSHELSLLVHFLSCHPVFRQPRTVPTEASCYPIPWARNSELALTQTIAELLPRQPGERSYAVSCFELPDGLTIFVAGDVSPNPRTAEAAGADYEDDLGLQELHETLEYLSQVVKRLKTVAAKQKKEDGREIRQARVPVRQAVFEEPPNIPKGILLQTASSGVQANQESITTATATAATTADKARENLAQFLAEAKQREAEIRAEMNRVLGPPEQLDLYRYVIRACRAKITHRWGKYFRTLDDFFFRLRAMSDIYARQSSQSDPSHAQSNPRADGPPPFNPYAFFHDPNDRKVMSFLARWCLEFGEQLLEPGYLDNCLKASSPHSDSSASTNSSSSDGDDPAVPENELSALIYVANQWPTHPATMADIDCISQRLHVETPNGMPMSRIFKKFFPQFKAVDDLVWAAKRRRFYTEVLERRIIIKGVRVLPATDCGAAMRRVLPATPAAWKSLVTEWLGTIPLAEFEKGRQVSLDEVAEVAAKRAILDNPDILPPGSGFVCAELQLMTYFLYTGEGLGRILSRYGIDWEHLMTEGPPFPRPESPPSPSSHPTWDETTEMLKRAQAAKEASREIASWKSKRIPFAISKSTSCQVCRMVMAWAEHKKRQDKDGLGNMFRSAKVLIIRKPINMGVTDTARGPADTSRGPVPLQHPGECTTTYSVNKRYGVMIPPTDGRFVSGGTRWAKWSVRHNEEGREVPSGYGGYRVPNGCLWLLPWGLEEKLGEERILRVVQELILMLRGNVKERGQVEPPTHADAEAGTVEGEEQSNASELDRMERRRGTKERRKETEDAAAAGQQAKTEIEAVQAPVPMVNESGKQEEGFPKKEGYD